MAEQVNNNYEVSDIGAERIWPVPYARLLDTTPMVGNPAAVAGETAGKRQTGVVKSIDAGRSLAYLDFTPAKIYKFLARNVFTYAAAAEATFDDIAIGDEIYYDPSATMPGGVYLSTSPLNSADAANTLFGWRAMLNESDTATLGGASASTQTIGVLKA